VCVIIINEVHYSRVDYIELCQNHEEHFDTLLARCLVKKFVDEFDCLHIRLRDMDKRDEHKNKPFCTYEMLAKGLKKDDINKNTIDPGLEFIR